MEVVVHTVLGQRLAVLWLGLTGVSSIAYAGFMPLPPASEPVPQVCGPSGACPSWPRSACSGGRSGAASLVWW
jgi:hypothetical protein